jgi:hypothetical protein
MLYLYKQDLDMIKNWLVILLLHVSCLLLAQTDVTPPTIVCKQQIVATFQAGTTYPVSIADALLDTVYDDVSTVLERGLRKVCMGTGFPEQSPDATYYQPGEYQLEHWVRDEAGNTASCINHIKLEANTTIEPLRIQVMVQSDETNGVEAFTAFMRGYHCVTDSFFMAENLFDFGSVCCLNAPEPGASFSLWLEKNDNPLNGVTTYDLVQMTKHIMGIEPLDTPYKLIAADVNYDGKITLLDVVLLRQVILGITDDLPKGASWRFIPADFQFTNPQNPFQQGIPASLEVPFVADPPVLLYKFIGIKVGDVN